MTRELRRLLADGLRAWRHYRLQGLLSVLGVVAGSGGLVLVLALGEGARREADEALARLGAGTLIVRSPPGTDPARLIAWERSNAVARLLGARLRHQVPIIVRQESLSLPGLRREQLRVIGTTPEYAAAFRLAVHDGRFLAGYDVDRRLPVCVAGWELGRELGRYGVRPGDDLRVGERHCRLVGLLAPAHRSTTTEAALPLPDFDRALYLPVTVFGDRQAIGVDELLLSFRAEDELLAAVGAVRRVLELSHRAAPLEFIVPAELLRQKLRLQTVIRGLLAGSSTLMLLVGTIGIMNMMLVNVLRRRAEIGLRRAVGATPRDVYAQFVTESVLVAGLGGVLGSVAGLAAALAAGSLLGWAVAVSGGTLVLTLGVCLALGGLAGGYPALQAARVEPISTLNRG